MGLIPSFKSIPDLCCQSNSFRHFRCIGLAVEEESLICEGLIKSMSARIHNGALR